MHGFKGKCAPSPATAPLSHCMRNSYSLTSAWQARAAAGRSVSRGIFSKCRIVCTMPAAHRSVALHGCRRCVQGHDRSTLGASEGHDDANSPKSRHGCEGQELALPEAGACDWQPQHKTCLSGLRT